MEVSFNKIYSQYIFSSVGQKLYWHISWAHLNISFSLRIVMTYTCTTKKKGKSHSLELIHFQAVNVGAGLHVNIQGTTSFAKSAYVAWSMVTRPVALFDWGSFAGVDLAGFLIWRRAFDIKVDAKRWTFSDNW